MKFGKSLHRLLEKVEDLFTPSRSRPDIDLVEELDKSWYAAVDRKPPSVSPVLFSECIWSGRAHNGPRFYQPLDENVSSCDQNHDERDDCINRENEGMPRPASVRRLVSEVATAKSKPHPHPGRETQLKQDSASSVHDESRIECPAKQVRYSGPVPPLALPEHQNSSSKPMMNKSIQRQQYNMKQGALSEAFSREASVRNGHRHEKPTVEERDACFGDARYNNNTSSVGSWAHRTTQFIQQRCDSAQDGYESEELSDSSVSRPNLIAMKLQSQGSDESDAIECRDYRVDVHGANTKANMSRCREAIPVPCSYNTDGFQGPSSIDWNAQFLKRWKAVKRTARLQALGFRNIWKLSSPKGRSSNHPPELLTDFMPVQYSPAPPAAAAVDCHRLNNVHAGGDNIIRDPSLANMLLGEVAEVC